MDGPVHIFAKQSFFILDISLHSLVIMHAGAELIQFDHFSLVFGYEDAIIDFDFDIFLDLLRAAIIALRLLWTRVVDNLLQFLIVLLSLFSYARVHT